MNERKIGIIGGIGGRGITKAMLDTTVPITVDTTPPITRETIELFVGGQKITVDKEMHRKELLKSVGIGVML